ncbi:hypothetical protein KEM55_007401, partial [Ascosphaera atra]
NNVRTVGFLLRDGVSSGPEHTMSVVDFGPVLAKRTASDILPYIPRFRELFDPLATTANDMALSPCSVRIEDLECLTDTMIKTSKPFWALRTPKELHALARKEFIRLCNSWQDSVWDEIDWSRIKELQVREVLAKREEQANIVQSSTSLTCQNFLRHIEMQHDEWQIKENISQLKMLMSDQNLQLLPDYEHKPGYRR